ncbi:3-dehydroquinate synthase [Leptospira kemamanensis]|uniref:3-dehydroquinate synthase n=1 Tax=Leptospira kemamanensis TaxID=2484942 RepID=A0A4R9JT81_9LEPT|nr:3-dehydroquinate synthase [Leptospira kemamanensis]TGL55300.1 3-dehydroquinate synthase [Leptospira kemamanensis]
MKDFIPKKITSEFQVSFRYEVCFTKNLFSSDNSCLRDFFKSKQILETLKKLLVVLDLGVFHNHPNLSEEIQSYFQNQIPNLQFIEKILVIPGGEECKNQTSHFDSVISAINMYGIDRHSYVMCIGGGALLDMVGYAAAVSHRGIRLIRIPTTVLSQNDSGVGVKNSINYDGKKNFLGTFAPPVAVFNDSQFLVSLDDRDWRSGISEAVKVSLIKDKSFFEWLENNAFHCNNRVLDVMESLIYQCANLHVHHISSGDPFEFGSSRPLDFGHWFAHKLEYLSNFTIRHGEAVAVGIALDSIYSYLMGYLNEYDLKRIIELLLKFGFTFNDPVLKEKGKENLSIALEEFREHLGGKLTLLMLDGIGSPREIYEMNEDKLLKAFVRLLQIR